MYFFAKAPCTPVCQPPQTPQAPRAYVLATPQTSRVVPSSPKPRGILKQKDAITKKRRVIFAGSDDNGVSTSDEEEVVPRVREHSSVITSFLLLLFVVYT